MVKIVASGFRKGKSAAIAMNRDSRNILLSLDSQNSSPIIKLFNGTVTGIIA
jgi:hypothetical protein